MSAIAARLSPSLDHLRAKLLPAGLAMLMGFGLVYATGLAGSDLLHSAAHDSRHAFAFPCH